MSASWRHPSSSAGGWWRRRSLTTRLVTVAVVSLTVALVIGTVTVVELFSAGRLRDLDLQTQVETDTLITLVDSDQLTRPLPVPATSSVLAQVLDSAGTVLAATPSASRVLPLVDPGDLRRRDGILTVEAAPYAGEPLRVRVSTAQLDGDRVVVVAAAPLADIRRAQHALVLVLAVVVPVLVALSGLLTWAVVRSALAPVEQMRRSAAGTPATLDQPALLPVPPGGDEIARLAGTLNELLARLHRAAQQQRAFVADAAHELRSPIASMRVQLDIAAEHPELLSTDVLAGDLLPEVERLGRLTDDLLLLARLEARSPLRIAVVDLAEVAGTCDAPATVRGDPDALARLVRNLRDNAERHAASRVEVHVETDGNSAVLHVDDDGPGIPVADRERVFQRWVRLDTARARDDGGSGLGLALVRGIAQAHGGTATAVDSPLGGTRVSVRLPLSRGVP